MIRSAVLRLSLLYMLIAIVICVGFSLLLYRSASIELENELRRPNVTQPIGFDFERFRAARLKESGQNLRGDLIILNIFTLVAAGGVSYYAARRTLQPIDRALKAQRRFAGDASHELRTPLAAMQTEIEVSLRDSDLSKAELRSLLKSNLEEISRLQQLSDNLLRLARLEESQLPLSDIDITEVIQSAWQRNVKAANSKKITFTSTLQPAVIKANEAALEELFYILFDNAVKYSDSGQSVIVSSSQNENAYVVVVTDQGQGIEPEKLPHIFERFYRADSSRTKTEKSGYGLGLAIADNIARLHKSSITAISKPGDGTTFTISLKKDLE